MGGIMSPSKEAEILKYIRHDKPQKLQDFLVKNNLKPDDLYTKRHRTLIQLCCYFSSPNCLSKLIEMNCDYNKKEVSNNYSPLYIACKFNSLDLVKILLSKEDIKLLQKSNDGLNELEISFIKGNYGICYYLLYEYKKKADNEEDKSKEKMIININRNKKKKANEKDNEDEKINIDINTKNNEIDAEVEVDMNQPYQNFFFTPSKFDIEKYNSLQASNQCPLFNMPLFYDSLCRKTPPEKCVSFAAERKRTKELLTKIPDPNETWGHFFKRLANLELYNPPLVDKRNVTQMNSLYMNAQMKLLEKEYGVKMSYYNQNEDTRNILDEDNNIDDDLIKIQNTEKKNLKIKNSEQDIINNNIEEDENNENVIKINANKNQRNPEEIKIGGKESVIALNIENSSDRNIKKDKVEDEE
jgi:hypothetical protein